MLQVSKAKQRQKLVKSIVSFSLICFQNIHSQGTKGPQLNPTHQGHLGDQSREHLFMYCGFMSFFQKLIIIKQLSV